jgi:hypothetical protein
MTPSPREIDAVRGEVRDLLERSTAYRALPVKDRASLANDMVKVGSFLADKGWLAEPSPARAQALAQQEDPVDQLKRRLAKGEQPVGANFKAGALKEGTEAFGELVKKVDFPKFVSGLVQGVFQAVVDASIQQMQAYGELLAATAKTVDQFASEHITDGQARDYVANRYPSAARVDTSGERARLRPAPGDGGVDLGAEFGVDGGVDLTDDESEQAFVQQAKVEMARSRQQLMATMVLLGINRIVVTNGHINAKVVFDMRASDVAKSREKAHLDDMEKEHQSAGGGIFGAIAGGFELSHDHETTVGSAIDDSSESKASVKAQLTGDVRLAFKSETFPLERMVDVMELQMLNQKATPTPRSRPAAAAPAVAAAPAPSGAAAPGGAK